MVRGAALREADLSVGPRSRGRAQRYLRRSPPRPCAPSRPLPPPATGRGGGEVEGDGGRGSPPAPAATRRSARGRERPAPAPLRAGPEGTPRARPAPPPPPPPAPPGPARRPRRGQARGRRERTAPGEARRLLPDRAAATGLTRSPRRAGPSSRLPCRRRSRHTFTLTHTHARRRWLRGAGSIFPEMMSRAWEKEEDGCSFS